MTGPVSNSSLTKAQLAADTIAEQLLQAGIVADQKLMASLTKYPQLEAALQQALNLIKSQFSSIIYQKYGETSQTIVDNLSQTQINSINSQINTVKGQISTLMTAISNLTTTQTSEQTAVTNDQNAIDALTQQINNLTPTVNALNTTVQNDQITVNNDQSAQAIAATNFQNATNQLAFDLGAYNNLTGPGSSIATFAQDLESTDFGGKDLPSQSYPALVAAIKQGVSANPPQLQLAINAVTSFRSTYLNDFTVDQTNDINSLILVLNNTNILGTVTIPGDQANVFFATTALTNATNQLTADQAILTTDTNNYNTQNAQLQAYITQLGQAQTQKATDQASLDATTALIASDNAQLAGYNSTLATLQAQLAAAQTVYNNGVAFFNKLTPLEKQMFKELYPGVAFPS